MVDCLVQLAARLAASPADTATAAAADASTTAAASAAQQAAAAGSAAAAAAVQRLEAAAALLQSAAVVLRCMPVGLHTVGSALPQVVRLMCALPENTSTPAVQVSMHTLQAMSLMHSFALHHACMTQPALAMSYKLPGSMRRAVAAKASKRVHVCTDVAMARAAGCLAIQYTGAAGPNRLPKHINCHM